MAPSADPTELPEPAEPAQPDGDAPTGSTARPNGGPLTGVRVVELGGIGPLPFAGMMFGDLGADVVLVGRPGRGELDVVAPERDPVLRHRRIVRADLTDPADLDRVLRLTDTADVLIEGFRPGKAERLGIGPEVACTRNPRLIYGRMTGWGQTGPAARTAGHDLNYVSVTGALHAMGRRDVRPPVPLNLIGDYGGGALFLVTGVLAALLERAGSGRGQVVDAAMVDGVAAMLQPLLSWRSAGLWSDEREDNLLDGAAPYYDTYVCADGRFVAVSAIERPFYDALLRGLGLDHTELPDRQDRAAWPALRSVFAGTFARHSRDEWVRVFSGTDACVTPVLSFAEAEFEPQLAARGTFRRLDGELAAAPAPRFSRTPARDGVPSRAVDLDRLVVDWAGRLDRET
jgi:alpha-methylacyl-CoA racemase